MYPGRSLTALLLVVLLAGCSTFDRDWDALAETTETGHGVEGRWSGTWLSDVNGHTGGLRCILAANDDGTFQARYHATYAGWITFEYTMPMTVRQEGETYHFAAEADLGWLAGGLYEYDGSIVGDEFRSTYACSRDHGTFEMTRVGRDLGTEGLRDLGTD